MADKIIIFSGKQYSGKDTAAKILMESLPSFKRCAMGDIIKIEYAKQHDITVEEIENNKPKYRQGLIDLGNWGRSQSPDYWLEKIIAPAFLKTSYSCLILTSVTTISPS